MAITTAITDLISSFLELFSSIFHTVYTIVHSFIAGILGLFSGFFVFIGDVFEGVFDVVGGMGRFLAGNIVILGLIAAAGYAYVRFVGQQTGRSGRPVANGVGKGLKTQ